MSKVWLVTGSAGGLGRNIAEAVLAAGDRLVAKARDPRRVRLAPLRAVAIWCAGLQDGYTKSILMQVQGHWHNDRCMVRFRLDLSLAIILLLTARGAAVTDYYNHVVFDNSPTPDSYFYSGGSATPPSTLQVHAGLLPVETRFFFTPPNALRLEWQSAPGGSWHGEVRVVDIRNRQTDYRGDALSFWCSSPKVIPAADLPMIHLADNNGGFSVAVELGKSVGDMPAGRWISSANAAKPFCDGIIPSLSAGAPAQRFLCPRRGGRHSPHTHHRRDQN
jgi:hypothetical protein